VRETLLKLLEPVIEALGYELVELEFPPHLLRIYIDREGGVTVDDCEKVSRQVSSVLDVEDPIPGAYTLEVSSPGLDRPLRKEADFVRFTGEQAKLELTLPLATRRNMGVIAKRPIANAVWRTGTKPASPYHHEYWRRIEVLQYDFLRGGIDQSVSIALRFTLAQPGVATAIVGTSNPDRWASNARLLQAGALVSTQIQAIRERWRSVASSDWVGQI